MKIPLFEILALIFILWPLIQRFLDKNKKQPGPDGSEVEGIQGYEGNAPSPEREEWERAMRELESIFTGEPVREPVKQSPHQPDSNEFITRETPKQVHSFHEERLQKEKSKDEFLKHSSSIPSSDVLNTTLDEKISVEDATLTYHNIISDVQNPQKIREFYVMKEVLDKPRSKRPVRSRLLTS